MWRAYGGVCVGQRASRRSGGLDSRARAVPALLLRSCGYWEEQRSAVTATAWRPLSPNAAEQALLLAGVCFPGAYRAQGPEGLSIAAGHRPGGFCFKIVRVFEFMLLTSAPGRIRTCAHGSGGGCCAAPWPAQTRSRAACPGAYRAQLAWSRLPGMPGGNGRHLTGCVDCTVRGPSAHSRDEVRRGHQAQVTRLLAARAGFGLQLRADHTAWSTSGVAAARVTAMHACPCPAGTPSRRAEWDDLRPARPAANVRLCRCESG